VLSDSGNPIDSSNLSEAAAAPTMMNESLLGSRRQNRSQCPFELTNCKEQFQRYQALLSKSNQKILAASRGAGSWENSGFLPSALKPSSL